jgi:hypothetical protein
VGTDFNTIANVGRNLFYNNYIVNISTTIHRVKVRVGKYPLDTFPIKVGWKKGDALSPLLFNFAVEYAIRKLQVNQKVLNYMVHMSF